MIHAAVDRRQASAFERIGRECVRLELHPGDMIEAGRRVDDVYEVGIGRCAYREVAKRRVARRAFIWTVLLAVASVMPTLLGYCTWYYFVAAALLGLWFMKSAIIFLNPAKRETEARKLFFISIGYLPLLLGLLVVDRFIFKL